MRIAADADGDWPFDALLGALNDSDPEVRLAAVHALGHRSDPRAADALIRALDDPALAASAVWGLGELRDPTVAGLMMKLLRDPRLNLRVAAARALGKVGDQAAAASLQRLVEDPGTERLLRGVALDSQVALGYEPADAKRLSPVYWALGLALVVGGVTAGATLGPVAIIPFFAGLMLMTLYWVRELRHARKGAWYVNPGTGEAVWVPVAFGGLFGGESGVGGDGGGGG